MNYAHTKFSHFRQKQKNGGTNTGQGAPTLKRTSSSRPPRHTYTRHSTSPRGRRERARGLVVSSPRTLDTLATGIASVRKREAYASTSSEVRSSASRRPHATPPIVPSTTHVCTWYQPSCQPRGNSHREPAGPSSLKTSPQTGAAQRSERMRASAQRCHCHRTLATHGAGNAAACIAARQTRQVIEQAAAGKGLRSKAQHRRRRRHLTLTVHNPTTERDLQPPSQGEPRHQTSHRHLAIANAQRLQHKPTVPEGTGTHLVRLEMCNNAS